MLFKCFGVDNNVVMSKMRKVRPALHQAFKHTRGVDQPKWQNTPLPQTTTWNGERSFWSIFLCYVYLIKPAFQI